MKVLSAILVMFLFVMSVIGTVSGDIIVETDITVTGTVIMDRELSIETESGYHGIKFYDNFWTPALGMHGMSNVSLGESIVLSACNSSVLTVIGGFEGENMKTDACLRNYDIGSRQSNKYSGDSIVDFSWLASNMTSEMVFLGTFDGRQRSTILVRNVTQPHHTIYDEDLSVKGQSEIDLSSVIIKPVCVGTGDWLGCP